MEKYRDVLGQVIRLAAIVAVCTAVMFGVYGALGRLDGRVWAGGAVGWTMAVAHFLILSFTIARALDRAEEENSTAQIRLTVQASTGIRLLMMAVVLIVLFRAGLCDPVAALIPLLAAQFALKCMDLFRAGKGARSR